MELALRIVFEGSKFTFIFIEEQTSYFPFTARGITEE